MAKRKVRFVSCLIMIFFLTAFPCDAADDLPVIYWELLDQNIYTPPWRDTEIHNWRDIRKERELRMTAWQKPKRMRLRYFPETARPEMVSDPPLHAIPSATLTLRNPCGTVNRKQFPPDMETIFSLPQSMQEAGKKPFSGRYILAAHLFFADENTHLYPKFFVIQYEKGVPEGDKPDVFLGKEDAVIFEIGPVVNNPRSKHGGGIQFPNRPYPMMVKYRGAPLPGARVAVLVECGGWNKRMVTDSKGMFTIVPTDDRSSGKPFQNYIYVAEHTDPTDKSRHIATLSVVIYKNRPEWTSKAAGFGFWSVSGCALAALVVSGFLICGRRRNRRVLAVFDKYGIK